MSRTHKKKAKFRYRKVIILFIIMFSIVIISKYNLVSKAYLTINPIKIEKIEISSEKEQIEIDESININSKIFPENYTKNNLEWHSSNSNIIEISNGKIVGKSVGTAEIYLTDDETISNKLQIECFIKATEVKIKNPIESLKLGEIYKLETEVFPENATYKELEYESSNMEIATIDDNGNIIANSIGKTNIIIKNNQLDVLEILELEITKIPVEKITLDDTKVTLGKGQTYILNSKVTPIEATYTDVEWKSSNTNVVTIKNRKLTAVGVGEATITAITDKGEKKASCNITVKASNPENEKLYANGRYNIRTGASTDYEILATTSKYEQIEFLQDTKEGWKKVRNEKGIVGYTLIKSGYYIKEKPVENTSKIDDKLPDNIVTSYHISNVPYLNQISLGYPTGCEAVSATMVLKYKGYNVSVQNVIDNTKAGSKKYKGKDGNWYGANPFEAFVGTPSLGLGKGSYGVFAKPIANAMSVYAGEKVKNISGCSEKDLLAYVSLGHPVVVWCVKNAGNLKEGVTWNYEDGSGSFKELVGEHCAVLIGYDEDYIYLNDPSAGKNVKQSRSKFMSNWKKLYSQAIVVE